MNFGAGSAPDTFTIFFVLIAAVVIGGFIYAIVSGTKTWVKNNNSPVETVDALVVSKRMNVSGSGSNNMPNSTSTWYYVTFELDGGTRIEFSVNGKEYGVLAEGDRGILTHQGTRYKGFERNMTEQ